MADVNIDQVVTTLKSKFKAAHQFIFWYDDQGEFEDSVRDLTGALAGVATVVELKMGHQLKTKLRLLGAGMSEKFLIYSPQPQPPLDENHLRDMVLYSEIFRADAPEILRKELQLPENMYSFVKRYTAFFGSKERRARFMKYDLHSYQSEPTVAIMAAIVRLDQPLVDFFAVLRLILKAGLTDNKYLNEFEKYHVINDFWSIVSDQFGFQSDQPDLLTLASGMYVTMAFQQMGLPTATDNRYNLSARAANVQTFMQQFSAEAYNQHRDDYDQIARHVWENIKVNKFFDQLDIDDLANSDVFPEFDRRILNWIQEQLLLENDEVLVDGLSIGKLTKKRREMHYGRSHNTNHLYLMVRSAWQVIQARHNRPANGFNAMVDEYTNGGYYIDMNYRHFVYEYRIAGYPDYYMRLKRLVERIYVDLLSKFNISWNQSLNYQQIAPQLLQRNFYNQYIRNEQNRIVVIISDSFRFEVGKELQGKLKQEDQVTDMQMHFLISGLPSVTYMGMPALLPHHNLALQAEERRVTVDGQPASNIEQRQAILRQANPKSTAYRFKDLQGKSRDELRSMFVNQEVIYIYHNQIDTTAENKGTEDETATAAKNAINELQELIWRLRTNSINHVYITADHGYQYRDEKIADIDKIEVKTVAEDWKSPRYLVSERDIKVPGVERQALANILENQDSRYVYYPTTANVFKANGGDNYAHGGSSLEEMVVPLLEVRTTSKKSTAHEVTLQINNSNLRVTSLEVPLSIMQTEPISSKVTPAAFKLYFVDKNNHQISGQILINANNKDTQVEKRIWRANLTLVDQPYDRNQVYDLVIENIESGAQNRVHYRIDIVDDRG
ncbi:BREX-1 system phosphatase PglZ type A [Lactiplantibacillus plantarum]|uniref:BREX-1 system phosphatase PglZ type A n=1 Tax=Lactiplantibacillus plantarum TaxID=1590 RepID=UPI001F4CC5B4|nr:BREX-1 system phosphatase PglZ type A [Lactiplantibacillus plantarum]MCH8623981.1 BREX-1 system phosphatase PglZ type A [Lactiplantibacillus plantarum]MCH8631091.1 BREX-1 system phosphatase PglZ type A [Lactiplantibacillus plantarum]MCH8634096.1 BREX-1 system phosphatase PglZ type A [Lactiplantibacillus plantarum]MCT4451608.1 BREX-1 system phosphatase PglZ type A [Lactiplantibacillus plantarum]MCT4459384.1 BREX-1 system phosphatase PglZ type A [Lactiplantibacillus plantarum]